MSRLELHEWARALHEHPLDVFVVGGGATGLGVAVQAALEGRRVALVDAGDFAGGTSSRSTKLLHGGVRYLAQGRWRMVREALRERAIVMRLAPHLAQPLPFVVAQRRWLPWALAAVGLKFYEKLAGRLSLGKTEWLGAAALRRLLPTWAGVVAGVRYWDGQFDDARLALALARTAHDHGAHVRNHTRVVGLTAVPQGWRVRLQDRFSGVEHEVIAKSVVNAAGVWVDALRSLALGSPGQPDGCPPLVRASQGVHLVVSRDVLPLSEAVLVPRTSDERVLFAVPWLGATVIGTTDTPRDDSPMEPRPMAQELAFLFDETRRFLGVDLTPADVRSVWVGLRPLVGSGDARNTAGLSREHVVLQEAPGFLTVTGGKWTTYRAMAEEVMAALMAAGDLPAAKREAHTDRQALHGAASSGTRPVSLTAPPGLHLFGTESDALAQAPGAERALGLGLTEAMVRFCARQEWAVTVEDMLARRWRVLFLDARLAEQMAPAVAQLLQDETGLDPQLSGFLALCKQYRLSD